MPGKLQVEMVGVGHGDCFIIKWEPAGGQSSAVVIDGGPAGGGAKLKSALEALEIDRVDLMVLTHTDADHVDGLLEYVTSSPRPPIARYWGPCLPAFKRHRWLFPSRVARGLDVAAELETAMRDTTTAVSYPLEHASWQSEDGGLRIRVLSPAGRLIERLLIGNDVLSLFLEQPMPIDWLFGPVDEPDPDGAYDALRASIASGEIDPTAIPPILPSSVPDGTEADATAVAMAASTEREFGIDPEFFGNAVLNDTSIVLLIEADAGDTPKRMLFTGDLQTFTYLMTNYPMGLGLELVKAPHHGSHSHVGKKKEAYDEVWQWLRPRAVLTSAGGKHGLPRVAFRNAVLRTGATLFCACRRSKEVLVGPPKETSCQKEFGCSKGDQSVRLDIERDRIEANAQACASIGTAGTTPVIQMIQHIVDPSDILDKFTTAEREKHVKWVQAVLTQAHLDRVQAGGEAGLNPMPRADLERRAAAQERYRAAAAMDVILDSAARSGKIWSPQVTGYRGATVARQAWTMPSKAQWKEMRAWLLRHTAIGLVVPTRMSGLVPLELLLAADTSYLARRVAEKFAFPEAMFADAIWPNLAETLITSNWEISYAEHEDRVTSVICVPSSSEDAFASLASEFRYADASTYLEELYEADIGKQAPEIPANWVDVIIPAWTPLRPMPSSVGWAVQGSMNKEYERMFVQPDFLTAEDRTVLSRYTRHSATENATIRICAAYFVAGYVACR